MITLTELCRELNNWFEDARYIGDYTISGGVIDLNELIADGSLQVGQYFRIAGSLFNDGVYQYTTELNNLTDEHFDGVVWTMRVPKDFLALLEDINAWEGKYNNADNHGDSPYQSESFGGYSYSKASGNSSANGGTSDAGTWQNAFRSRLNKWRKIRP